MSLSSLYFWEPEQGVHRVTCRFPGPAVPGLVDDVMVHYVLICLGSRQAELCSTHILFSLALAPSHLGWEDSPQRCS